MIDSYISVEQGKREQQELDRIQHNEASLETDLYSGGFFDGLIGLEPSQLEVHSYWSGYQLGYREYWAQKLSVEIPGDRLLSPEKIAAASPKTGLEEDLNPKQSNRHSDQLIPCSGQNKVKSEADESNPVKEKNISEVDYIVNSKLVPLLDGAGIPINRTLKDLLKLYPVEKVESAISLVRSRKREQHIPNPSGYFVAALKGDWGSQNVISTQSDHCLDQAAVFRHWYDLARELGYCSGQEIREGEQWVCLSGSWENWQGAMKRGYSLEYLKGVMKRSQGQ